jgi:hypothetical protein
MFQYSQIFLNVQFILASPHQQSEAPTEYFSNKREDDGGRYWVTEMHIDGFRFDLASIMTRASSLWDRANVYGNTKYIEGDVVTTGTPLSEPPLIDMMSNDPILCGVKVHICLLFSLLTFLLLDEKIHVIFLFTTSSFEQ